MNQAEYVHHKQASGIIFYAFIDNGISKCDWLLSRFAQENFTITEFAELAKFDLVMLMCLLFISPMKDLQ